MKTIFVFLCTTLLVGSTSCNRIKKKAKDTINKSGEKVGEGATEFFEGMGKGIDKALSLKIILSESLKSKGISAGKNYISSVGEGSNNQLTIYFIFENDFRDTLIAKAYDKEGMETGRCKMEITGKNGDAGYFDFIFDSRTRLESKSIIKIE